jgi:feruloyl-CoA synthase
VELIVRRRADGAILVDNALSLPPVEGSIVGRLRHWAAATPSAVWLSAGDRRITFAAADAARRHLCARLLALPVSADRPIMILGDNGIDHALVAMAATGVGVPVAVVSAGLALPGAAPWAKLARTLRQVEPGIILADHPALVRRALAAIGRTDRVEPLRDLAWLDAEHAAPDAEARAAEAAVGLDTVAKLLFTSGSTGTPKAVINTQRMMVSNMLALSRIWPFLMARRPVMVDWLPWNHTFGGNCCFNIALWFGGHLHIDSGRPTPALMGHTIAAIRAIEPSVHFNVPLGHEMMLPILEADTGFARDFFGRLDFVFNAGAALPGSIRQRLEQAALRATGRLPTICGGWGSTETAPFSTAVTFPTREAANLGVPVPGTTIKMVPAGGRYELRVKGPNVTPGYWRDAAATAAAFDEEGFYRIGDAGKFADPEHPAKGILFDGRTTENFKLNSGTFVNVGLLRLAIISAGGSLISDAVIAGEGRNQLGALLFANEEACRALLGDDVCAALGNAPAASHPDVLAVLAERMRAHNAQFAGSSLSVARFLIAAEPPSAADEEITDKGYLNQRRVLARRSTEIERLFAHGHHVAPPLNPRAADDTNRPLGQSR